MNRHSILVVRGEGRFSESLREDGCDVLNLELVTTEPLDDLSEFVTTIRNLDQYDGILLTSPVAAEIFLGQLRLEDKQFDGKVYVLGERSKGVFDNSDLQVFSNPDANTARDLIDSFERAEFAGKDLLFIRGDRSVSTIPAMLKDIARVDELVVYRTVDVSPTDIVRDDIRVKLKTGRIDWACFFSPSGVDSFMTHFGDVKNVRAAAIGETTANRAAEVGLEVAFISQRSNAEDFAAEFAAYIKN